MRNKLKRSVLASLLAASMTLGSLSINVFADTGLNTDASVLTSPEKLTTINVENNLDEDNDENSENGKPEDDNTNNGNTEGDNTNDGNTEDDNTNNGNTEGDNTNDGSTEGDNTNDGNTEDDNTNDSNTENNSENGNPENPANLDNGNTENNENNGTEDNNENGKSEDAVQAVVELINALPAEITEETDLEALKAQVTSARTAYDALTEGQKAAFDPEVLAKLTALEQKLSEPKPEKVTLTYDANAGDDEVTGLPSPQTVKWGSQIQIQGRNMKRDGYTFKGWSTDSTATEPDKNFIVNKKLLLNEDITLYAVWEELPDVTLTYDANADGDKVTGLPKGETVKSGDQVSIKNYRNMVREGYKILGWNTDSHATNPDSNLENGHTYTLEKDTTLYAVWEKIPDGAQVRNLKIQPVVRDSHGDAIFNIPDIHYNYTYVYDGKTYSGTTETESLGWGMSSTNQLLEVLVDKDGTTPTEVQLTITDYDIGGYTWYAQQFWNGTEWKLSNEEIISISVTPTSPAIPSLPDFPSIFMYTYYKKNGEETDKTVTEREVDIVSAFLMNDYESFTLDKVSEDYSITYSYQDVKGETVTKTLYRKDAKVMETPRAILGEVDGITTIVGYDEEHLNYHLKWTVNIPVIGDGIYLTMTQSNYDVTEDSYVWDHVFGTTKQVDSENIGRLYVSKDNNPVTPYIYNVYAKEYTVTYTDGVENSVIFADQIFKAKEGAATPTISNPTRSGYTFTGWSPAVAETVTGDVTYTAQWSLNSTDPDPDPTPTPTPEPEPLPYTGGGDDDTPTIINDTPVPTTTIEDEDVPLADLPEDLITIEDEEVPLKNNPSTGDMVPVPAMAAALLSIGGIALLMKKRR